MFASTVPAEFLDSAAGRVRLREEEKRREEQHAVCSAAVLPCAVCRVLCARCCMLRSTAC